MDCNCHRSTHHGIQRHTEQLVRHIDRQQESHHAHGTTLLGHDAFYDASERPSSLQHHHPTSATLRHHSSGKEEKEEAADVRGKEGVVVIVGGVRYPAMVDVAVVSTLRQKRKRRRLDVSKGNVKPVDSRQNQQKRARRPESRPPARPFKIKEAWEA